MPSDSAIVAADPHLTTKVVHSVCSHDCPDSCGVLVTVETRTRADGTSSERATKIAGDPAHPVTQGFLCAKVAKYLDRVYSPNRLLYPMRRRPGAAKGPEGYGGIKGREAEAFERISWDEALDTIAERFRAIANEHGPESILPYSYAGTIGQLGFGSMDRRFFYRLGASQLARTICSEAGGQALKQVYGTKLGTRPEDFAHAGLIVAWGANIHGNNIHLWPFIEAARQKGARLIVIDPYRTRTAAAADEFLQIRPGTDTLLALGIMHVLFTEELDDRDYFESHTNGADALRAHTLKPEHAPEAVAEMIGLAAEKIVALARDYGRSMRDTGKPAVIRLNYGVQRSEFGGTAVRAISMLPLITGAWKHVGGGLQLSTSGAFPFNSDALQMPELMKASPLGRDARVVNMSRLGEALTTLGCHAKDGPKVKALFVYNSNPAAVAPNQNAVLRGMRRHDLFTVVHEQFFTDTTDYADIVLPSATFLETKDVQGAYGHYFAQVSNQAITPLGEAHNNTWVFRELAARMGFKEACFSDSDDDLIDQTLTPAESAPNKAWLAGIDRGQLEREGHAELRMPRSSDGHVLPFSTPEWFGTAHGRAELLPVPVFTPAAESRHGETARSGLYPLEFLPRKADNFMNSTFANLEGHQKLETRTEGALEIHSEDARARGVSTGDMVEIFNGRGSLRLRALVDGTVPQGVVAARLSWNKTGEQAANVNALTGERVTDIGAGATFYSTLVQVRKT
jgi:anaerobic selenocysteine-containing dehydrogenase